MTHPRIAMALHLAEIMNHYRPIIRALGAGVDIISCAPPDSAEHARIAALAGAESCACIPASDVAEDHPYDVLLTNQMHVVPWQGGQPGVLPWAERHVRLTYALGKTEWNLAEWNRYYDLVLCFGPYQQRLFEHRFAGMRTVAVSYPRFDAFFDPEFARTNCITQLGGSVERRSVVWLPTYGSNSSIPDYAQAISRLTDTCNTFVKLHPATPGMEPERYRLLRSLPFTALIDDDFDNVPLFGIADWVLADYGGSAFGAIYTDRNLLLLNVPGDLFAADTGWLSADVQLRDDFVSVNPENASTIPELLEQSALWHQQSSMRAEYRSLLFAGTPGQGGTAAAKAILELASSTGQQRPRSVAVRPVKDELLRIRPHAQAQTGYSWRQTIQWAAEKLGELRQAEFRLAEEKRELEQTASALKREKDDLQETARHLTQENAVREAASRAEQQLLANLQHQLATTAADLSVLREQHAIDLQSRQTRLETALQSLAHAEGVLEQRERELGQVRTSAREAADQAERTRMTLERVTAEREQARADIDRLRQEREMDRLTSTSLQKELLTRLARLRDELATNRDTNYRTSRELARVEAHKMRLRRIQDQTPGSGSLPAPAAASDLHDGFAAEVTLEDNLTMSPITLPEPATPLRGDDLRVVMICDDVQIDRRILQEAASLDRLGYEVIILGRSADGYPADERIGNVKVERLNYESYAASRAARRSAEQALQAGDEADADIPLSIDGAEAELAARLRLDASGKPRYPAFVDRLPRTPRVLLRALFWPPYRLDLIRRAAPRLHWTLQYLIYLPTLAVTPWPRAVAWHWRRIASRMGRSRGSLNEKPDFTTPAMQALEHQVSRFDDMNVWELAVYERALLLQPDIVHVHDLPQLRPGVFVSRRLGIPALYDAHELYPEIHTLTPDQQERLAVVEKHFSPRVNAMITVNPFIARRQAEWYGIQEPAVVLNAAEVDELIELTRPDTLREALGLDASAAVLLFQGWISIDRRIGDLVSAMPDTHESVHLVLLGYGTDIPALKQLAQTLGVAHRVHFPPPVPQSELMHWVSSADAGMIPYQPIDANHLYCSPNKLFEFIAATVPIIANDLPYLRSVVADNGFGIVQTLNTPADYAAAINAMFDPALGGAQRFRATIRNGREAYLWPAQEKVLYGIYDAANITAHRRVKTSPASANISPTSAVPAAARHLAPQSLRIFHGLHNIAGIPSIMARAERALGLDSRAVCFSTGHFAYKPDIEEPQLIAGNDILARFRRHAEAYDIFVFHFGHSLANDSLADIPLLKRMGKRIVFYFHGCDIRQSKETIRKYRFSACAECWPPRCNANRDHALDFALRFADAIWVSTPDLLEFVPGAELFVQPIDIDAFEFRAPAPSETSAQRILLHAPSDPKLKGTAHLLKAVEAINANGPRIDLQLLQGLANSEVRERILSADIAVDQLLIGSYGMFAVELMASGVPVICNIRQDLIDKFPEPPPVIRADPDNLADVLLETLLGAELWPDLAVRARRYAETYHSAEAAARRSTATYQRIMGKTLSAEHEQQDRIRHTASR